MKQWIITVGSVHNKVQFIAKKHSLLDGEREQEKKDKSVFNSCIDIYKEIKKS